MLESEYQGLLMKKIAHEILPGSLVIRNNPNFLQGVPDLTVFHRDKFAFLEVKASAKSKERPNQRYYVERWQKFGAFSEFIYPENEEEVLRALQHALGA